MKKPKKLKAKAIGVGLGGLVIAAVLVVLAVDVLGGEEEEASSGLLSETGLLEGVAELEQPVYWVGPYPGTAGYELEVAEDGGVSLHYVADGGGGETESRDALVVAGYPIADARGALLDAVNSSRGLSLSEHGVFDVLSGDPHSAYAVYSSTPELQIEIYSPEAGAAERLAEAGALIPLE